jgi:NCS1 family nucleobase:cation symporter-1
VLNVAGQNPGFNLASREYTGRHNKLTIELPPEWGVEPVPVKKKILRSIDYLILWSSLAIGLLVLQAGSLLIPGLSLVEALAVALFGSIIGSAMLAAAGSIGSKYGIPTMVSLRGVLGREGSYLPTLLNVLQLVSWAAFEILIMSDAAMFLGPFLGDYTRYFWIIFFAGCCMFLALGGPVAVVRQWLKKFAVWIAFGATAYITYIVLSKSHEFVLFQGDGSLPIALALDLVIAMPISWWPLISDYNRFSKSEKGAFVGTISGYTFANFWFYSLGALLVLAYPGTDVVRSIVSITFGALALIMLLVDETDNGFADIYSAAVSIQNVSLKFSQRKLIVAITIVSVIIAALLPKEWQLAYESFLLMYIGPAFVPLLGVLFADFYLIRRGEYSVKEFYASAKRLKVKAMVAWAIGIIAYFLFFYVYTAIGSSIPSFIASALSLYALEKAI